LEYNIELWIVVKNSIKTLGSSRTLTEKVNPAFTTPVHDAICKAVSQRCELRTERAQFISKYFCKWSIKKFLAYSCVHFTNKLNDIWAFVYMDRYILQYSKRKPLFPDKSILSRVGVVVWLTDRFRTGWLESLTPYTHSSGLQAIQRWRCSMHFTVHRYTRTTFLSLH
jgi:hypothetical protein